MDRGGDGRGLVELGAEGNDESGEAVRAGVDWNPSN